MANNAMETCSPVESSTSISRADGSAEIPAARSTRRSVESPMAETTTAMRSPRARTAATFSATRWMSSTEPTEVPPYFWTIVRISRGAYRLLSGDRLKSVPTRLRAELGAHEGFDALQRRRQCRRVIAAGLREVRTSTALSSDLARHAANEFAGLHLAGLVSGDAGHQSDLVSGIDRSQHDDRG